jgi:hypothetical protein
MSALPRKRLCRWSAAASAGTCRLPLTGCEPCALCRSRLVAAGDNHWTMRCFEVTGTFAFVCFANGKVSIYDTVGHELVRKPFAAHTSEIKHITRGHADIMITSCLDNQVCTPACAAVHIACHC